MITTLTHCTRHAVMVRLKKGTGYTSVRYSLILVCTQWTLPLSQQTQIQPHPQGLLAHATTTPPRGSDKTLEMRLTQITLNTAYQFHMLSWILGTKAYEKLSKIVSRPALIKDIRKISPDDQTSSLEGYHATLNHWHPKMIHFSWIGTYCRYVTWYTKIM